MGELLKSKIIAQISVMEVANGGIRSRDEEITSSDESTGKRRRIELENDVVSSPESSVSPEMVIVPEEGSKMEALPEVSEDSEQVLAEVSEDSEQVWSSISSSFDTKDLDEDRAKSVDLKVELFETENSALNNGGFSRETTPPPSQICATQVMESSSIYKKKPAPATVSRKLPAEKMPSAAEIEDFFSAAEKYEQKRFTDKYNYDVVKDAPVEGGRFEWIKL